VEGYRRLYDGSDVLWVRFGIFQLISVNPADEVAKLSREPPPPLPGCDLAPLAGGFHAGDVVYFLGENQSFNGVELVRGRRGVVAGPSLATAPVAGLSVRFDGISTSFACPLDLLSRTSPTQRSGAAPSAATPSDATPPAVAVATAKKERTDPEPSNSIFLGNLSWNIEEETVRAAFKDCGAISRIKWVEKDGEFRGIAFIDFESVEAATKAVALNGVDLGGRPARINFSKPREPRPADPNKPQRTYKPQKEKPEGCVELFIGNLPWSIDDDKITNFFKSAGTVTNVRWLNDRETQEFKGVGFVTFSSTEEVDKAVELAGESIDGRQIRIDYAGQKKEGNGGGNTWQKKW